MINDPMACDPEVFAKGEPVALLDVSTKEGNWWVAAVADRSGQRVDWHYSGGIAQVLFLGDRAAVISAIRFLEPELKGRLMRVFEEPGAGIYRAGVTETPKGTIAGFMDTDGEQVFIVEKDPL